MRHIVKMPKVSDSNTDIVVLEWCVELGAHVEAGDPLVRVETSKTEVEVPAPVDGTLAETLVDPEGEVEVGTPLCVLVS